MDLYKFPPGNYPGSSWLLTRENVAKIDYLEVLIILITRPNLN